MKNKILILSFLVVCIIIFILFLLPLIKIKNNNQIKYLTVFDHTFKYEGLPMCYNESYSYHEGWNVSIYNVSQEKILFFNLVTVSYKEGNVCETEYLLEESYIDNFLNNAEILSNDKNISLDELVMGKKAIVGNKLYLGNDYNILITYKLDGKYQEMYIFYVHDLLVIQVGSRDDGAKFIAYE